MSDDLFQRAKVRLDREAYRPFWAVFLTVAIIGTITWLAIFEHNYHPRIYGRNEDVTILAVGDSDSGFQSSTGGVQHLVAEWR